ncbi:hypothetical protein Tco_0384463, partial [Tanacetum coccineum]
MYTIPRITAHNGTITMKAVKAMSKQQLIEEYENICRCLEKDRLLSAQYNLFRPKPAIGMLLLLGVLFRQFKLAYENPMSVLHLLL